MLNDERFPQDGSPISREAWLSPWPVSKRGNDWVRAFGLTYTLRLVRAAPYTGPNLMQLVVVGPGGVRVDKTFNLSDDKVKEVLWNDHADRPATLAELQCTTYEGEV